MWNDLSQHAAHFRDKRANVVRLKRSIDKSRSDSLVSNSFRMGPIVSTCSDFKSDFGTRDDVRVVETAHSKDVYSLLKRSIPRVTMQLTVLNHTVLLAIEIFSISWLRKFSISRKSVELISQ